MNDPVKIIHEQHLSMVSASRLQHLAEWVRKFQDTSYSFVECGVAKGGCVALMKSISNKNKIFGFDSFEGMPELTEGDEDEEKARQWVGFQCSEFGIDAVYQTFRILNLNFENVFIVKGWFEETLKFYLDNIGEIAILRLDNDWYRSTRYCLELLYPQVISGGVVLVDDYGCFKGCRNAVDEYRLRHDIKSPLIPLENHAEHYWTK
jgi:hypothetical protein